MFKILRQIIQHTRRGSRYGNLLDVPDKVSRIKWLAQDLLQGVGCR